MEMIHGKRIALQHSRDARHGELLDDSNHHRSIAAALGICSDELAVIDRSHNDARLLYRHCGGLAEAVCDICFRAAFIHGGPLNIPNTSGGKPRKFGIDWALPTREAIEIKWREGTTDGDHIRKEMARLRAVKEAGYVPVRLILFEPDRVLARRNQAKLRIAYEAEGGVYHAGPPAFWFIHRRTGIDLAACFREAGGLA